MGSFKLINIYKIPNIHSNIYFGDSNIIQLFYSFHTSLLPLAKTDLYQFMEVRKKKKALSRIFCSTSFSEKLARTFLTVKLDFITKKSFCAERFEIVLNGYFFVLKRKLKPFINNDKNCH
ncbi:hypothetical protein BpHYR1_018626 [Brachionus plicatilis]|uniref:Uncharacterized protein n=1 Tax=Brachionus plicatilis TaxID=10195 RepID=A0A3M7RUM0_BRAPC|nr:hypothetical protein BpHYR1_018626 [Brachionus plicatilis]